VEDTELVAAFDAEQQLLVAKKLSRAVMNQALVLAVLSLTAYSVFTVDSSTWRGWYPYEILLRIPVDNWKAYEMAVTESPVPVKAAITGVTYFVGDWLAQSVELGKSGDTWADADPMRVLRSALVGLVLLGPLAHFYYEWVATLDWAIPFKILLDQTAYLAFYNTVYFMSLGTLAGKPIGDVWTEYRGNFWELLTAGWKLWPLVAIVTYTLIPPEHRVLWIDAIEIVYSALLSTIANKDPVADPPPPPPPQL